MHVLFCIPNGNPCVEETNMLELIRQCQKNGHHCHVSLSTEGSLQGLLTENGIPFSIDTDVKEADLIVAYGFASFHMIEEGHSAGIPVAWIINASDTDYAQYGISQEHFRVARAVIFSSEDAFEQLSTLYRGNFHVISSQSSSDPLIYNRFLHLFAQCVPTSHTFSQPETTLSLIMRASKPDALRDAVEAAIILFPHYKEFVFAVSPQMPEDILHFIRGIPRSKIIKGTAIRNEAGDLHYRLIDACSGEWIVNVDDDDLWTYAPNLIHMTDDVGLVYGYCFFMNHFRSLYDPERFSMETGMSVTSPELANRVPGSHWILRKSAWDTVSKNLKDRSFNHSDWRLFYYLVKSGWTLQHQKNVFGIMKRFVYEFPTEPGNTWMDTFRQLENTSKSAKEQVSVAPPTRTYLAVIIVRSQEEYFSQLIDSILQQSVMPNGIIVLSDTLQELPLLPVYSSPCPIDFYHADAKLFPNIIHNTMQSIQADYLLFTEIHDILHTDFMQKSIDVLQEHTDVSGAFAHTQFFGQSKQAIIRPDKVRWQSSKNDLHSIVLRSASFLPTSETIQWQSPWENLYPKTSILRNTAVYNARRKCEPVANMQKSLKIYVLCSPSHKTLLEDFFLASLCDECTLIIKEHPQVCLSGNFMTEGWNDMMIAKVQFILSAIEENWGSIFVHSDADVQFFGSILPDIYSSLEGVDMCIQCDRSDGEVCAGFFASRGNERTKALWSDILARMQQGHHKLNDQDWLNRILLNASNIHGVRWNYLPESFMNGFVSPRSTWEPGDSLEIPEPCILHHANWTVGVAHKIAQMRYVRKIVSQRANNMHLPL